MRQFDDDLNTAVFTTKYVLDRKSPILYVNHYDDGSWEFLGSETNLSDDDFRIISLEEIINIDSTILEVSNLPLGGDASRISRHSQWKEGDENGRVMFQEWR